MSEERITDGYKDSADIEWEAEKICRWAAARAGVIVVAPLIGTMTLMANEVYMITRLAELRGIKLSESAVLGLLGSLHISVRCLLMLRRWLRNLQKWAMTSLPEVRIIIYSY